MVEKFWATSSLPTFWWFWIISKVILIFKITRISKQILDLRYDFQMEFSISDHCEVLVVKILD